MRGQLPKRRYEVFDRDTNLQVELFRPENVPLGVRNYSGQMEWRSTWPVATAAYGRADYPGAEWRNSLSRAAPIRPRGRKTADPPRRKKARLACGMANRAL